MKFLLLPANGGWTLLQETEPGVTKAVGVLFEEQLATRVRDLVNRHGLVDVLVTAREEGTD